MFRWWLARRRIGFSSRLNHDLNSYGVQGGQASSRLISESFDLSQVLKRKWCYVTFPFGVVPRVHEPKESTAGCPDRAPKGRNL